MFTLLLADDSLSVANAVELAFANHDIKVVAVLSGDRAIAQLEIALPDLILADIGMAGLDGYAVAAYVSQTERLRHIPVVLLASPFEPVDEERARRTLCCGVLVKPFTPDQIVDAVTELLEGRPLPDPWPAQMPRVAWSKTPEEAMPPVAAPSRTSQTPRLPQPSLTPRVPQPSPAPRLPQPSPTPLPEVAVPAPRGLTSLSTPVPIAPTAEAFEAGLDELDRQLMQLPSGTGSLDQESAAKFAEDVMRLPPIDPVAPRRQDQPARARARAVVEPVAEVAAPTPSAEVAVSASRADVAAPRAVSAMPKVVAPTSGLYRLRIKIGDTEFDAEGPQEVVQQAFSEFKRMQRAPASTPPKAPNHDP